MLHSGKIFRALRDEKNKYSNSCVVRKKNSERNKKPYPPFKLNGRSLMQGWFFFQLSNWFQLIFLRFFPLKSYRTQSDQVKNGPYKREWRCFKLFFIDLQLFYFLFRIIPDFERQIFCFVLSTGHTICNMKTSLCGQKNFFFLSSVLYAVSIVENQ